MNSLSRVGGWASARAVLQRRLVCLRKLGLKPILEALPAFTNAALSTGYRRNLAQDQHRSLETLPSRDRDLQ
jgi:hypothetical protein